MPKQFIATLILVVLVSACNRQATTTTPAPEENLPVLSYTQEVPIATSTPNIVKATEGSTSTTVTNGDTACPGAPVPHVAIGQQVSVVVENFDKLKLRSAPEISPDTDVLELEKFTQLKVLEGPVCVSDTDTGTFYWFWKVNVPPGTDIGWVAEGDSLHYFIE
jgi:hypothetical protein